MAAELSTTQSATSPPCEPASKRLCVDRSVATAAITNGVPPAAIFRRGSRARGGAGYATHDDVDVYNASFTAPDHARDACITFTDATHTYHIKDVPVLISVTALRDAFFPKFNGPLVADRISRAAGFYTLDRYEKYRQMLPLEAVRGRTLSQDAVAKIIAHQWQQNGTSAASTGTNMHRLLEWRCGGAASADRDEIRGLEAGHSVEARQFDRYVAEVCRPQGRVPFRTEQRIFTGAPDDSGDRTRVSGSVDMQWLLPPLSAESHVRPRIVLADWKRTDNLRKPGFGDERAFGPLGHLPATNASKYALQLCLYKYILEQHYGVDVVAMEVVAFHPSMASYDCMPVRDLGQDVMRSIFALWVNHAKAGGTSASFYTALGPR